jgi:pyridoxal phosphate enzyme (YggS family)
VPGIRKNPGHFCVCETSYKVGPILAFCARGACSGSYAVDELNDARMQRFVVFCVLRVLVLMSIAENIAEVQERVTAGAKIAGRNPQEVTLMAVSKTFSAEAIREAYAAGLRVFGENRVQEFAGKVEALRALGDTQWHMIGHLQTNKAAKAAELFDAVDSVDSWRMAEKLNASAQSAKKTLSVLLEINVGGEQAKSGAAPDSGELEELLQGAPRWEHLQIGGLMTIPPYTEDPQRARPYFQALRQIRDSIGARKLPRIGTEVLSMGMSHDFEVAIEEGATCVRVGTAIFGQRRA